MAVISICDDVSARSLLSSFQAHRAVRAEEAMKILLASLLRRRFSARLFKGPGAPPNRQLLEPGTDFDVGWRSAAGRALASISLKERIRGPIQGGSERCP